MTPSVSAGHLKSIRKPPGNLCRGTVVSRISIRKERHHIWSKASSLECWYRSRPCLNIIKRQSQGIDLSLTWCAKESWQSGTSTLWGHTSEVADSVLTQQMNPSGAEVSQLE